MNQLKKRYLIISVIAIVVTGIAGFFVGSKYQEQNFMVKRNMMFGQFGQNGVGNRRLGDSNQNGKMMGGQFGQNGMMYRPIIGEILSKDEKSLTVKLVDGSSKIVLMSSSTPVSKSSTGSSTDLTVGSKIEVFGSTNNDGSVTAQNILINPLFGFGSSVTPKPSVQQ